MLLICGHREALGWHWLSCHQTKVFPLKWAGPECGSWGIVSNLAPALSRLVAPRGIPGGRQARTVVALGPSKNGMLTTRQAFLLLPSLLCLPVGPAERVLGSELFPSGGESLYDKGKPTAPFPIILTHTHTQTHTPVSDCVPGLSVGGTGGEGAPQQSGSISLE